MWCDVQDLPSKHSRQNISLETLAFWGHGCHWAQSPLGKMGNRAWHWKVFGRLSLVRPHPPIQMDLGLDPRAPHGRPSTVSGPVEHFLVQLLCPDPCPLPAPWVGGSHTPFPAEASGPIPTSSHPREPALCPSSRPSAVGSAQVCPRQTLWPDQAAWKRKNTRNPLRWFCPENSIQTPQGLSGMAPSFPAHVWSRLLGLGWARGVCMGE